MFRKKSQNVAGFFPTAFSFFSYISVFREKLGPAGTVLPSDFTTIMLEKKANMLVIYDHFIKTGLICSNIFKYRSNMLTNYAMPTPQSIPKPHGESKARLDCHIKCLHWSLTVI